MASYSDLVVERLLKEMRSLFNDLIEDVDKYKQLFSLSEQFPHDYHGRFLVELIQNANDAGQEHGLCGVKIVFDEQDARGARLYVANGGSPFSDSNFAAICKLGQSDKDPEQAVGNKGIGFRSVLQVCTEPRIYSDHPDPTARVPGRFGGYCFRFTPKVRDLIAAVGEELATGYRAGAPSRVLEEHLGRSGPVYEEESRIARLLGRVAQTPGLIAREAAFISPYSLPLPLTPADVPPVAAALQREGYVTVVELPLKDPDSVHATHAALEALGLEHLLFTSHLNRLEVAHRPASADGPDRSITYSRTPPRSGRSTVPAARLGRSANRGGGR
jgi:Histidine kinase-, DNA gyrase B-, and HSP90-like ATPase